MSARGAGADAGGPGGREAAVAEAIGLVLCLLPIAAVLMHRAVAPIFFVSAALAVSLPSARAAAIRSLRAIDGRDARLFALALAGFCALIALSGLWSPRGDRWTWGPSLLACAGGALVLVRAPGAVGGGTTRRLAYYALGAIAASVGLLLFEAATSGAIRAATPPERANRTLDLISVGRGMTAVAPLVWPAMLLALRLGGGRAGAFALLAAALAAAALLPIETTTASLALGAASGAAALVRPRAAVAAVSGLWFVGLALAPVVARRLPENALALYHGELPRSWIHRLVTWREAGDQIAANPWGGGVEYARHVSGLERGVTIDAVPWTMPLMPVHPHSVFLQIWLEAGPVGAALFAALLAGAAGLALRAAASREAAALVAAIGATVFVSVLLEASLWQMWRVSSVGLACCVAALALSPGARVRSQNR